jgi:sec-independent protein translocase protein TatC
MSDPKVMSLIDHLTELRTRLLRCLFALFIGMGVAWHFSPALLSFVERPLSGHTYLNEVKAAVYEAVKQRYPSIYARYRPGPDPAAAGPEDRKLNYSAPLEPFFVQVKISLIAGAVLALPVILQQLWLFVAPGLTPRERRLLFPFVTAGTLSFIVGALFFLLIIWPVIINFSLSYETEGLRSWFNLTAYINFCLRLITIFGLVFELPVVAAILARIGLINARFLARQRKFAVLASAIVAAFHADLITMAVVWIPLYLMYELSIWIVRVFERRQAAVAPAPARAG